MDYQTISFQVSEGLGYLTFNRPQVRNAINMKMIEEVEQVIDQIHNNDDIDILLITGASNSFCAGADTTEFLGMTIEENQQFLERFNNLVKSIEDLSIPVIGIINGFAFGGGAEIAAVCDFRIASRGASFRFPSSSYGLVVSTRNLPIIVGASKAKELIFRSCIISAEEAFRIRLADHLIEDQELYTFSKNIAKEIQSNSKLAIKKAKEAITLGVGASMSERRELEKKANQFLVNQTNYRQTFSAFVEKRKNHRI